jgi:hypothetical protein
MEMIRNNRIVCTLFLAIKITLMYCMYVVFGDKNNLNVSPKKTKMGQTYLDHDYLWASQ